MYVKANTRRRNVLVLALATGLGTTACIGEDDLLDPEEEVGSSSHALQPFVTLTLQNGWSHAPFGTRNAEASLDSGIVYFRGAISGGTSSVLFTLVPSMRPPAVAYVPVDLCNATKGRLIIQPSGVVSVEAEGGTFANAQCFTSLEGASFAVSAGGFTQLSLQNGWTHAPFSTSAAAWRDLGGVVHLRGAIANGTSGVAFTLPGGLAPATSLYVPVDLCSATKGRLFIQSSGVVMVQAEGGAFTNAQCFTSLEGVSFAVSAFGFAALALQNGWTHAPFGTSVAAGRNLDGNVYLKGAVAGGTGSGLFTLPSGLRPNTNVYVPIDLCDSTKGRLLVQPSGSVSVQTNGAFSDAQCFTSLDGVSYSAPGLCTVNQNVRTSDAVIQHGWDLAGYSANVLRGPRDCGGVRSSRDVTVLAGGGSCSVVSDLSIPAQPIFWANELCARNPNMVVGNSAITDACNEFFAGGSDLGNRDCRYIVHEAGSPFVPPFQPSNDVTCQPAHNATVQVPAPCP
jgi:hypothetical protein